MSIRIIEFLAKNAVMEKRFQTAAQYYFLMGTEFLKQVERPEHPTPKDKRNLKLFEENAKRSEVYLAYRYVHELIENPY